jgi:4-amino-4-deoxy-L-arabinose transferase-like glycosyltransferase
MPSRLRPWLAPAFLAAAAVLLHLACGGRYGFFRDELYFVACGKRLAWGYVDQPPLIAAVARLGWWLSGDGASVMVFRLPAVLANAGTVLVAAAIARQLGGGAPAMALASAAVGVSAVNLAQGHLLTMNVFEILLWSGTALAALQAASGQPRRWFVAGALLGLGLLTKYSAGFLALALFAGLAATGARRELASRWLWAGVGIAALLALPAVLWQWRAGLPFLELIRNGQLHKNAPLSAGQLLGGIALEEGLLAFPLAVLGLGALLLRRDDGPSRVRFLGVTLGLVAAALFVLGGKPYYFAPLFPPLFAAGARELERRLPTSPSWKWAIVAAVLLLGIPGVPMAIPLLAPEALMAWQDRLGVTPPQLEHSHTAPVSQHFADQFGWQERVAAVAVAWAQLPEADRAHAVIFTTNYGRAAAIELLGRRLGLPQPISGHNNYHLWGLPPGPHDVVLALGGRAEDHARSFAEVVEVGRTPLIPYGIPDESNIPIYVLRRPTRPLAESFQEAKRFL